MTDVLTSAHFSDLADNLFWREIRAATVSRDQEWLADAIAREVIAGPSGRGSRQAAFVEELIDGESFEQFVRDLLDDVQANVNPTDTIKRRVKSWALGVAAYELERGEHD